MRIIFFAKAFAGFTILAMLAAFATPFLVPEVGAGGLIVRLFQYEALAFALALLLTIVYPRLLGVSKGERVLIITNDPVANHLIIRLATALEHKKLHELIKVGLDDGSEVVGLVDSYPGIISPARVSVKAENNLKVI
ncbi:MAG: hypothetical protein V1728_02785 [Candidatus Micrarchaeota archaeon]